MEGKERIKILLERINQKIELILEAQLSTKIKLIRNREEVGKLNRELNLKLDLIAQNLGAKIDRNRDKIE